MLLKNIPSAVFVQATAEVRRFERRHRRLALENVAILPRFSIQFSETRNNNPDDWTEDEWVQAMDKNEFYLVRRDVSNMIAMLNMADASVEQCHEHLADLSNIQARFRQISGTKLENIPNILITEYRTMQSVYDLYMEESRVSWIMSIESRYDMNTNDPVFESMHALLDLYTQWRLLEDALRPCLYKIGTDDRRQFSDMELLSR